MPSRRELLAQAIAAALDGPGKPAGLTVHRSRLRPLTRELLPAAGVYLLTEATGRGDGPRGYKARRALTVRLALRCEVPAGQPHDAAIDPLLTWAVRVMMADPTWGGLAHNTQETATTWDADETDAVYAAAAVDFTLDYLTAAGDPDAP